MQSPKSEGPSIRSEPRSVVISQLNFVGDMTSIRCLVIEYLHIGI